MANTVSPSFSLTYTYGNHSETIASKTYAYTPSAAGYFADLWNVGTSEESIASFGDVATMNYCYLYNTDGTNYVEIGRTTGSYFAKLLAGQMALIPLEPGITIYAKANTAAVNLLIKIFNA